MNLCKPDASRIAAQGLTWPQWSTSSHHDPRSSEANRITTYLAVLYEDLARDEMHLLHHLEVLMGSVSVMHGCN